MTWPSPQDYNEAVQTPASSFIDTELQSAAAECNKLGLPHCVTGAFASVYHMHDNGKDWAVRCFLHPLIDRTERYGRISDFIMHDDLSYTVSFQFLEEGVRIHGTTYPLLKMDWVRGETFGSYVRKNLGNSDVLLRLAADFQQMVERLQQAGVAHGDLQHDNILMSGDELILVDYDGLFVPSLTGREASELGHRNYQHPFRTKAQFGAYLDNFSSWLIFLSLQCLAIDPDLWHTLKGGDDCLLLRQRDFADPLNSSAFLSLESHKREEIRRASRYIRSLLFLAVNELPPVKEVAPDSAVPDLPGLEYDRKWWSDYTGTKSGAPPAHKRGVRAPAQAVADAARSENAMDKSTVTTGDTFPEIKTGLAFKEQLPERATVEIESEIRAQLPADEQIVWTGGLDPELTVWDRHSGHEGSLWLNRTVLAMFLVFCTIPFLGTFAMAVFFLMLVVLSCMLSGKPLEHLWYALTDRRLIVVFHDRSLGRNSPLQVISIPLSEMVDIHLLGPNNSITVVTRREINMTKGEYEHAIHLHGFNLAELERFRIAFPSSKFISVGASIEPKDRGPAILQQAVPITPDSLRP